MRYDHIVEGIFVERTNRFIAEVLVQGILTKVHVRNTGRCKELLIKGTKVFLEPAKNKNRKTKYSLIVVNKGGRWINMDAQIPNYVVKEGMRNNKYLLEYFGEVTTLKSEVTYGASRFDLYYENKARGTKGFIEVKGVTLEEAGVVRFPDAPTIRGTKHIHTLIKSQEEGYESYIFFLVQMVNVDYFQPNQVTDPIFTAALKTGKEAGVGILCFDSIVEPDQIILHKPVAVCL